MRSDGLRRRGLRTLLVIVATTLALPRARSVEAAPPVVSVSAASARVQVTSASLTETIDALSRAAGFKVTYDGPRPSAMLFNTEIDTPTVALTLFRLLDGQNLNYGVVFDLSGKKVTSLMVLGPAPKTGGTAGAAGGSARTQPTNTSRGPRREVPAVEDDPPETEPEPTPQPNPVQAPAAPPRLLPGGQAPAAPPSPFAPRSPFGTPFGPRPTPSPSA